MTRSANQRQFAPQRTASLFDHLVGAGEQRRRDSKAERRCRFQVDYQFVLRRRLIVRA
jgi:hypothetical protein